MSSTIERAKVIPDGTHVLEFLGMNFRGGLIVAEFLSTDGEIYTWPKALTARTYVTASRLWRALGFPFREMRHAGVPPEEAWRPAIGRRVTVQCSIQIGPSGKEYAEVQWEGERG